MSRGTRVWGFGIIFVLQMVFNIWAGTELTFFRSTAAGMRANQKQISSIRRVLTAAKLDEINPSDVYAEVRAFREEFRHHLHQSATNPNP